MSGHFKVFIVVEGEEDDGEWREEATEVCTTETFEEGEEVAASIKHEIAKWRKRQKKPSAL